MPTAPALAHEVQVAVASGINDVPDVVPPATIPAAEFDPENIIPDQERYWPFNLSPENMISVFAEEADEMPSASPEFLQTVQYAVDGEKWAVKETAHNFAHGIGVDVDYKRAYEWALTGYFMEKEAGIADGVASTFINDLEQFADAKGIDLGILDPKEARCRY